MFLDDSRVAGKVVSVGISGHRQNGAVAVAEGGRLLGFCELERISRIRGEALASGTAPYDALGAALDAASLSRSSVTRYVTAEEGVELPPDLPRARLDHHHAHAAAAFLLSPFDSAAVVVCDRHSSPPLSVWLGTPDGLEQVEWPTGPRSFAEVYAEAAVLFDFRAGSAHELEALARLGADDARGSFDALFGYQDGAVVAADGWADRLRATVPAAASATLRRRAALARAFQERLGEVLVAFLADVRRRTGASHLSLGGGLFFNTALNAHVCQAGVFDDVFVAPNPGNAGVAAGAAVADSRPSDRPPASAVSPFLGPAYDAEAVKRTLDNCKLSYEVLDESALVATTVAALVRGELVGWFQGRMEWGHRALGHRSILASPLSPYVLDNLNTFLKHRERHRTYGVSVPIESAAALFDGPPRSAFMEFDYAVRDTARLSALFPEAGHRLRVQTIPAGPEAGRSPLFRTLHEQFGHATGLPVLVNTSFNGFREPMVCSPRDAVRVFFGSGLDRLVVDRFVVRK